MKSEKNYVHVFSNRSLGVHEGSGRSPDSGVV